MSTRIPCYNTRTERIMASLREKNNANKNTETFPASKFQSSEDNLSVNFENENLIEHDVGVQEKTSNPDFIFIEPFESVEYEIPSDRDHKNTENYPTSKFQKSAEDNLRIDFENKENLIEPLEPVEFEIPSDLDHKSTENFPASKFQRSEDNRSVDFVNKENLIEHDAEIPEKSSNPDFFFIEPLEPVELVEFEMPSDLDRNLNHNSQNAVSDLATRHSYCTEMLISQSEISDSKIYKIDTRQNSLAKEFESIVNTSKKNNKRYDKYESDNSLSEFEEDTDDSVKDPDFVSSSSASCSTCSSSSSSTSSSDEEEIENGENKLSQGKEGDENNSRRTQIEQDLITSDDKNNPEPENNSAKKVTKKRQRHEPEHIKTKAKILRNAGKEYTSSAKSKKIIPAKKIKGTCKANCIFN